MNEAFADYFASALTGDPEEAEYRNDQLWIGGAPVDLIYKRVLISELIARGGLEHPVVRAVQDRAVCMVNPFRSKILHKKASLAVLSDEANAHLFTSDDLDAIRRFVPWTRVVRERLTTYGGRPIDLVPFMVER